MKTNTRISTSVLATILLLSTLGFSTAFALNATQVNLFSATNFAVLAGSTITNTGSSVINGNLGLNPGTSVTGFPPGTVNGTQYITNAQAAQAQADLVTAYTSANQTPVSTIPAELGGTTKVAGVYTSADGTFGITGQVTLDAQNDPTAVFIFKSASTLTTGVGSNVVLTNGAQACNVFWQVGSSATLGTNSSFKGTIIAMSSITVTTGTNVEGRVLARNGAVTLDTNAITVPTCAALPVPAPVIVPEPTPTPTPVPVATTTPVVSPVVAPVIVIATTTVLTVTTTPTSTPVITQAITPAPVFVNVIPTVAPQFPDTGFAPETNTTFSNVAFVLFGIFLISATPFIFRKKITL
ncbi:MAG: ice-binding family protein [Candidatus Paceibacterota bacterium]